jgi:predicted HicB family RNase H-like nuclease
MRKKPQKERKPMLKATIVRLTPELWRKAKLAALNRETTLQKLVADALEAYLKENN